VALVAFEICGKIPQNILITSIWSSTVRFTRTDGPPPNLALSPRPQQADNPTLTRMHALRQAMTTLMEGGEAKDEAGKTLYTYAHPLF
jgi:hypothetical protein